MSRAFVAAALVLALLAGVWLHGSSSGAADVRARWSAQQLADRDAADAQREVQRLRAAAASRAFEATRSQLQARVADARSALRADLQQPLSCPTGATNAPTLADLLVPATAVGRLRDAAGQGASAR